MIWKNADESEFIDTDSSSVSCVCLYNKKRVIYI